MSRRAQDWATVGVAAVARDRTARSRDVALTNMGATPLRAKAAEDALAGGGAKADAAALGDEGTEPSSITLRAPTSAGTWHGSSHSARSIRHRRGCQERTSRSAA